MPYYAVLHGRTPGVYDNWDDCKKQIHEFKGAKFQKLEAKNLANALIEYQKFSSPQTTSNLLNSKTDLTGSFYAVFVGKVPGIYSTWLECQTQINKYPEAKFKKLTSTTLLEAQQEYQKLLDSNRGIAKAVKAAESTLEPLDNFLTVDGASNGENCEYQAVWYPSGEKVFASKTFQGGTNNIAEFLGLIHGLHYLMKNNKPLQIYTDSVTAMAWVRDGKANTTANSTGKITEELEQLIKNGEDFLAKNAKAISNAEILKWQTKKWGEIPADYGRKSKKP